MADEIETRVGYVPDHRDFGRFILSQQARQPAIEAARAILRDAQAEAQKDRSSRSDKVHFADRFKVDAAPPPVVVGGNPRAGAVVLNDAPHAASVEFGNKRQKGKRYLGRAGAKHGEMRGRPG